MIDTPSRTVVPPCLRFGEQLSFPVALDSVQFY